MKLQGAKRDPHISGIEKLPGTTNYFLGRDPSRWRTGVANYAKVEYEDVYPGIDLVYYGKDHELESDFIVQPAARPSDIRMLISGIPRARTVGIDPQGNLTLPMAGGEVRLQRPVVYQRGTKGEKLLIDSHYVLSKGAEHSIEDDQEVALEVGDHDRSKILVIDPVITISTYFGGSSLETATSVAADAAGNVYFVGSTFSNNFPTVNPIQPTRHGSNSDAFVTKINAAGTAILYSTYLGGSFVQQANGVAVDAAGDAYVVGQTASTDFPVTQGAFDTSCNACGKPGDDAFVLKLDSTGSQLVYSTYLGGSTGDIGQAIAVDTSGFAFVTGGSYSLDFPTTPGAFQQTRVGGMEQVFVTEFNASGSALNYSTYLGAGQGFGIALNATGDSYIAGAATDATFPTTPGAFQTTYGSQPGSGSDAFITELNSGGSALLYSTFLGGANDDYAGGVAIDSSGNAYVAGQTFSANFPVKNAYQQTLKGAANAYVAKLNPNGTALLYSTYLGGSSDDDADAIAVDSGGNAYVTGFAQSTDFPMVGALQGTYAGGSMDAFLTVMDPNGVPFFSTFIGGMFSDQGNGVAVDASGNAYLTGFTQSNDFPTVNAIQPMLASGGSCNPAPCSDAFLVKFSISTATPPADFGLAASPDTASITAGQSANFNVALTPIGGFNQSVPLSCSVQPVGPTCSISPSTLTSDGLTSPVAAVKVGTIAATLGSTPTTQNDDRITSNRALLYLLLAGLYSIALFVLFKRKDSQLCTATPWVGAATILFFMALLQACGGGSGGNGGGGSGGGTNPGTYTITVTGTTASLSHSTACTLTVN